MLLAVEEGAIKYFARGSITVRLTARLTGLDSANQVNPLLMLCSNATKSKPDKLEVSHTVILPLQNKCVFSRGT